MSAKATTSGTAQLADEEERAGLRRELEARGVPSELAASLAGDLAALADGWSPDARRGALTGVALAAAVQRDQSEAYRRSQDDLAEVERLMRAFATELKKVDEAVKILSTFVTRVREQAAPEPDDRILH